MRPAIRMALITADSGPGLPKLLAATEPVPELRDFRACVSQNLARQACLLWSSSLCRNQAPHADMPVGIVSRLALARLTALRKPDGGVRGSATGDVFRRAAPNYAISSGAAGRSPCPARRAQYMPTTPCLAPPSSSLSRPSAPELVLLARLIVF